MRSWSAKNARVHAWSPIVAALLYASVVLSSCGDSDDDERTVDVPVGLAAVTDLETLPVLRPPGFRSGQVSSYDRTNGNIDSGLLGQFPYSYLYEDDGRYVIFDQRGPGVVYRIWMTGITRDGGGNLLGDIAFEIDGQSGLQLSRADLFSGATAPFLFPLAGNAAVSSGGYFTVVPIPFAERLRISTSNVIDWLQISYAELPAQSSVTSFDPALDVSHEAATLAAVGEDPKATQPTSVETVEIDVAAGDQQTLWTRDRATTVLRFELLAPPGAELPSDLRLLAWWDEASRPQVDAPVDGLFGADLGEAARSLAFGRDADRFYLYFAMPFERTGRIAIANAGGTSFRGWRARISAVDGTLPGASHFYATANAALADTPGVDYTLLETSGRGHVVAVTMTAGCAGEGLCQFVGLNGDHLEADEHIYLDRSRYPQIHGTGLEDFFNGGFYWQFGAFALPTHGNPVQAASSVRRPGVFLRSAYRVLVGDAIVFHDSIRFGIEHGGVNDAPAELSSVVMYYRDPSPGLVETDTLRLDSATSRNDHAYQSNGAPYSLTSTFRGDTVSPPLSADGERATAVRFRLAVDPRNRGVRLRRLADIGAGRQSARVLVDGEPAGIWQSTDINPDLRWADLDFEIPPALTSGKSQIEVEIDATESPTAWTAFEYGALSYVE